MVVDGLDAGLCTFLLGNIGVERCDIYGHQFDVVWYRMVFNIFDKTARVGNVTGLFTDYGFEDVGCVRTRSTLN